MSNTDKVKHTLIYTSELQKAYDFFNEEIFNSELPECIIVLCNANKRTLGYYHHRQYVDINNSESVDKIALNPQFFALHGLEKTLSTLVHEMCHLWRQRCCDKPSRGGYHCKKWGTKMKYAGLYPSNTGKPGGKETGQCVSHYIIDGGLFQKACKKLIDEGLLLSYMHTTQIDNTGLYLAKSELIKTKPELKEIISITTGTTKTINKSNRIKYICDTCKLNIWGKQDLILICGTCRNEFKQEK